MGLFTSSWLMNRVHGFPALLLILFSFCSENVVAEDIPANLEELVLEKRRELIETVSEVDDKLAEAFLSDEPISAAELEVFNDNPPTFLTKTSEIYFNLPCSQLCGTSFYFISHWQQSGDLTFAQSVTVQYIYMRMSDLLQGCVGGSFYWRSADVLSLTNIYSCCWLFFLMHYFP